MKVIPKVIPFDIKQRIEETIQVDWVDDKLYVMWSDKPGDSFLYNEDGKWHKVDPDSYAAYVRTNYQGDLLKYMQSVGKRIPEAVQHLSEMVK